MNTANIDYAGLLIKYLRLVGDEEGIDFLRDRPGYITEEEWAELLRLAQVSDERVRPRGRDEGRT